MFYTTFRSAIRSEFENDRIQTCRVVHRDEANPGIARPRDNFNRMFGRLPTGLAWSSELLPVRGSYEFTGIILYNSRIESLFPKLSFENKKFLFRLPYTTKSI